VEAIDRGFFALFLTAWAATNGAMLLGYLRPGVVSDSWEMMRRHIASGQYQKMRFD
jgi:hypothetical protein